MNYEVLSYEVGALMAKAYVEDHDLHYIASSMLKCFGENEFIKKEMEVGIVTELLNTMEETPSKETLLKVLESFKEDLDYLSNFDNYDELDY